MLNKPVVKWLIFLLVAGLVVYAANPAALFFVNDDFLHVPLSGKRIVGQSVLLRPVSELSIWADYTLWNRDAAGYHIFNLLVHLTNAFLVYFFLKNLLKRFNYLNTNEITGTAWFVSCLFLIYPSHIESVMWILGRGASLSTFFILGSLILLLRKKITSVGWLSALFLYSFSLMAYEQSFIMPLLLLVLYVTGVVSAEDGFTVSRMVSFWLLLAVWWGARFLITGYFFGDYVYDTGEPGLHKIWQIFYHYNTLVARAMLPPMASGKIFLAAYLMLLVFFGFLFFHLSKKSTTVFRIVVICAVLFLISLLPYAPLGIDTHDTESTRFLYFPAIFFLTVLSLLGIFFLKKQPLRVLAGMGLFIFFAGQFIVYARHYKKASEISKSTIGALQYQKRVAKIFAAQVPAQYHGAMIFRSNFQEALRWQCPGLLFDELVVLSHVQVKKVSTPYKQVNSSFSEQVFRQVAVDRRLSDSTFLLRDDSAKTHLYNPRRDLLLVWTDSTITKIEY